MSSAPEKELTGGGSKSREKSLKRWQRQWKIDLIEKTNPEWFELFAGCGGEDQA